ncbi:MAG: hypothetical protein AB7U05_14790 [Mangrovibacterium sp.]
MKNSLLLVFLTICYWSTQAQPTRAAYELDMLGKNGIIRSLSHGSHHFTYDDIKGSPYLHDDFAPSRILSQDSSLYSEVPLRYNIYSDNIEFTNRNGEVMEILDPDRYQLFMVGEESFMHLSFADGNTIEKGYFQVLVSGPNQLLKRYRISYRPAEPAKPFKDPEPPKFVHMQPDLYISVNGQPAEKITNTRKAFDLLQPVKPEIADWVKNEKLNLKKEEDLIQLIQYSNQ